MACKITIRKNINEIIDREIPEKMVYAESAVKQAVSKLNKIWGIKIASSIKGAIITANTTNTTGFSPAIFTNSC
jgi:hypothetical protein